MPRTIQLIYFDPSDHEMDGCGWNMIDMESIASRYKSVANAIAAAEDMDLPYIVLSSDVTPQEALDTLIDLQTI